MMSVRSVDNPGVLLASASSGGAIAAVRNLGKHGVDVHVVSSQRWGAAAWSRHTRRSYRGPAEIESEQFLDRLLAIGKANPGLVLLPTSDETAWLYTARAAQLGRYFRLYQPSLKCIRSALDKQSLAEAAVKAGLEILPSWEITNREELSKLVAGLPYPILIKPRTHVQRRRNDKGIVVDSPIALLDQHDRFVAHEEYRTNLYAASKANHQPFLQQFVHDEKQSVEAITGFVDRTGTLFVSRRSRKVFQRSQPIGVGICHEALPATSDLSKMAFDLCRHLNYFGLFEIEFIRHQNRCSVIDFNPRLYNQIGLDIKRGMPLPLLAFLDASGQRDALAEAVELAQTDSDPSAVFLDRFTLNAILVAESIFSKTRRHDRNYWRKWAKLHDGHCIDVANDFSDPLPAVIHALSELSLGTKALPRFVSAKPRKLPSRPGSVRKLAS